MHSGQQQGRDGSNGEVSVPPTFVPGFHDRAAVEKMTYRRLGGTGLVVSALGCGASGFGGCFGDTDDEESCRVIREAIRRGVNYIDTAPWYGQGRSEEVLGRALREVPREAYYIATKAGRYSLDPLHMFDFSAKRLECSARESLARLGLDYVDVFQVHDVEFAPSKAVLLEETLPALGRARDAGLARFVGVTGYPTAELMALLRKSPIALDTVLSYCHYTLFDTSLADTLLPLAERKGVGLVNAAPLGMGLLTADGPQDWHPGPPGLKARCRQAAELCLSRGVNLSRLAINFPVNCQRLPTTVVSYVSMSQLETNLAAATQELSLHESETLHQVRAILHPGPAADPGSGGLGLESEGPGWPARARPGHEPNSATACGSASTSASSNPGVEREVEDPGLGPSQFGPGTGAGPDSEPDPERGLDPEVGPAGEHGEAPWGERAGLWWGGGGGARAGRNSWEGVQVVQHHCRVGRAVMARQLYGQVMP